MVRLLVGLAGQLRHFAGTKMRQMVCARSGLLGGYTSCQAEAVPEVDRSAEPAHNLWIGSCFAVADSSAVAELVAPEKVEAAAFQEG